MRLVKVQITYDSPHVTGGSRMFLYGDPEFTDLSWAGTAAGGHHKGAPEHPYRVPAPDEASGLERLDARTWCTVVTVAKECTTGVAVRVAFVDAEGKRTFNCGANLCLLPPPTTAAPATERLYPYFFGRRGSTEVIPQVPSPQLHSLGGSCEDWKRARDITVFLPAGYSENLAKPFRDILVLHDGQKFRDETWPLTIDALVLAGAIDELVVVAVPSPPDGDQRMAELTPLDGDGASCI